MKKPNAKDYNLDKKEQVIQYNLELERYIDYLELHIKYLDDSLKNFR